MIDHGYVPPGWPAQVRPPGAPGWERTATAFLLDCCPPEFRGYPVLRRHPVVLARFAARFVAGQCTTAEDGVAEIRTGLPHGTPPPVVTQAVEAWLEQAAHLLRVRRAVGLIEQALRGRSFVEKL
ncbi:MAG: hypothetical protein L0H41_00890 [Microlunatus sp.]|nr:hypothetical protein [Microlunatus sp.]MDN5769527.1 hypothetical protein [Microlunatus sp.]